jgi:hypothetical protein
MTLIHRLPGARPLLLVGVAVLVGALALLARSSWKGALLPGGPNASSEEAREADLEQKSQETLLRIKRKHRVAQELWAGRLTLLEAAALFRALDRGPPAFNWEHFRNSRPGNSDDERYCHVVIDWVYYDARHEMGPCKAEALRQGLDAQLREHLRRGPVRLRQLSELPPWIDD